MMAVLKKRRLEVGGTKEELAARLRDHLRDGKDSEQLLQHINVPMVQQGKEDTDEVDLDENYWNKEAQKQDNRRCGKLFAACKENDEFYWLPLGPHFPVLVPVYKNHSFTLASFTSPLPRGHHPTTAPPHTCFFLVSSFIYFLHSGFVDVCACNQSSQ